MLQTDAITTLKLGFNVFLTGAAGAGKTYVLNRYIRYLREHQVVTAVTASTGIAATHLSGQTIHSWSGIGTKEKLNQEDLQRIANDRRFSSSMKKTQVLIIDEVSMLHAYQLDMVDAVLRFVREPTLPFGGLQIVLCGDFFQLPPVNRTAGGAHFVFESNAWKTGDFKICYIHEQYRQISDPLLKVLDDIRSGNAGEHTKVPLRIRYKKSPVDSSGKNTQATLLYARNISVDSINQNSLQKIPGQAHVFAMTTSGFRGHIEGLKRSCLAPEVLNLKVGAEVMFVKNSQDGIYVNGTRGRVESFEPESGFPEVRTLNGKLILAAPVDWRLEEMGIERSSITQVPLRLAWAITVHKSQGMTLDTAEVDLSDAFEPGMGYVALSRVRTLDGLKLMGLNEMALKVHPNVLKYDGQLLKQSQELCRELSQFQDVEGQQKETLFKRFHGRKPDDVFEHHAKPRAKAKKVPAHETTRDFLLLKAPLNQIAETRGIKVGTVLDHIDKLRSIKRLPDITYIQNELDPIVFAEVKEAFLESEDGKLKPIWDKFEGKYSYEQLKLVRVFLE